MASWDEKLLTAAREGNIKEVELCVKNRANLEYREEIDGMTPLMFAALFGHLEVVMFLVTHGSQLQATSKGGLTALHHAAQFGRIDTTKWLIDQGCSPLVKSWKGKTPYDLVKISRYCSEEKKKEVMDFLKTVMLQTPEEYNTMLNRLTGQGTYESFDMRCMVTGQFAVGKSSLVKLLVGDVIPEGRHPTDGISLHEGRCGLDVQTREWILINPETYNAMDVVYNKVLMTSNEEMEPNPKEKLDQQQASDTSPSGSKDDDMVNPGVLQQSQAMALPLPLNTSDNLSKQLPAALTLSLQASSMLPLSRQQLKQKMKAKMTKDEIRIKMEKVLKSGKYKMKVGRLIFWDFGGQYVYYTTHQTFMTYRALFLVVFDGSKGLHEQVPDLLCFPGQHMAPTPAVFLQHWVNCILTYCKAVYAGIPKILFVATHKDKVPRAKEQCEVNCPGLQESALDQMPSDIELQRFASRCDETTIRELAIHLGMSFQEWEELRSNYDRIEVVKYRILVNWREKCSGKFSNMAKALTDMHLPIHTLCQIRRIKKGKYDINEIYMDWIPTDEILDALAQVIGVLSFQLGIELELPITSIDNIQHDNGRNLVAQCKEILFQWRNQGVRPTIGVLVQALLNVGRGTKCLEEIIKTVGVKKYVPQKQGNFKTFLKKLNPFQKKK